MVGTGPVASLGRTTKYGTRVPSWLVAHPCDTSWVEASNIAGSERSGSACCRIEAMPARTCDRLSTVGCR